MANKFRDRKSAFCLLDFGFFFFLYIWVDIVIFEIRKRKDLKGNCYTA